MSARGASGTPMTARRVAVGALGLWGLVHVLGGTLLVAAGTGDARDAVLAYATGAAPDGLTGVAAPAVARLVQFHGFNLAIAGVAVTAMAWRALRRWPTGVSPSLAVVTVADVGLVAFLLVPGTMAVTDGLPGPMLLAVALVAAWRAGWRPRRSRTSDDVELARLGRAA